MNTYKFNINDRVFNTKVNRYAKVLDRSSVEEFFFGEKTTVNYYIIHYEAVNHTTRVPEFDLEKG